MNNETLFLYLNGELDKEESAEVVKWISEHPEKFEQIKFIWEGSKLDLQNVKPDISKAWDKISVEIAKSAKLENSKTRILHKKWIQYAAIAIIFLGLGSLAYFAFSNPDKIEWIEYAHSGQKPMEVELPDGSKVSLNKQSRLLYQKGSFLNNREIVLVGEAFFEVKKNPDKPFLIHAGNTITRVLGTSFNVDATDTLNCIIVTVKTGEVAFYENVIADKNELLLSKGETGSFFPKKKAFEKTNNTDENYLSWKTKVLMFDNTSIPEVCKRLSQYFDTIIIDPGLKLNKQRLTAKYENKSLEEILNSIDFVLDVQHKSTEKGIILFGK
jgi:transmembrane sensor